MIVKANMHKDAVALAGYMLRETGGKRVEIIANMGGFYTGLTEDEIMLAAQDMMEDFKTTNGQYPCRHVQISPDKKFPLTPEQAIRSLEVYREEFKKLNRQFFGVVHRDKEGMHLHMALSNINPETGKMDPNKMWRDTHDRVRRKLELEFGHPLTPLRNENKRWISEKVTELYQQGPQALVEGVERLGYVIAYGGRGQNAWHIVDSGTIDRKPVAHPVSSLIVQKGKRISEGQFTKFMADYMKDHKFKTLDQALKFQKERIARYKADLERAEAAQKRAQADPYAGFRVKEKKKKAPEPQPEPQKEVVELDTGKKSVSNPVDRQDAFVAAIDQFKGRKQQEEVFEKKLTEAKETFVPTEMDKKQDAFAASIEQFREKEKQKEKFNGFKENFETDEQRKAREKQERVQEMLKELERDQERKRERGRGR